MLLFLIVILSGCFVKLFHSNILNIKVFLIFYFSVIISFCLLFMYPGVSKVCQMIVKKYPAHCIIRFSEQGIKKGRISINLFLWYWS